MKILKLIILLLLLGIPTVTMAQGEQHFKWTAQPSEKNVKSGDKFFIKVEFKFEKGWHTYSTKNIVGPDGLGPTATEISLEPKNAVSIKGKIKSPAPHRKFDEGFGTNIEELSGTFAFEIPVVAKKNLDFSKDKINVVAYVQQCKQVCVPPTEFKIKVSNNPYKASNDVNTEDAADNSQNNAQAAVDTSQQANIKDTAKAAVQAQPKQQIKGQEQPKDFWSALLLAMAAGAAALLTPCVFPMVPITVSFFTKRSEKTKGKGLRDAIVYALGIIITFTSLGVVFAAVFKSASAIQDFTANPWVNFVISAIFIIFALSLFGAYEIQIPTGLTNKLNQKSMKGDGIGSVILMGLTFSLASFSCTGPLVAAALVGAANGEWFYPIVSMIGFSTVLAAPFFLLALFPSALSAMPKAGGWMNNIKVVLGFVVVAATLKFLNNAFSDWGFGLSRELFLSIWVACSGLITLYIIGLFKTSHDSPVSTVSTVRLLWAMAFGTLTIFLMSGFSGKSMGMVEAYLPAPEANESAASMAPGSTNAANNPQDVWLEDYQQALQKAKAEGKALFIDFSGKHCTNCRMMERNMFPKASVQERLSKMVKVRLITDLRDDKSQASRKMQETKYQSTALPLYVIITPDEQELGRIAYTDNEAEFLKFLDLGAAYKK